MRILSTLTLPWLLAPLLLISCMTSSNAVEPVQAAPPPTRFPLGPGRAQPIAYLGVVLPATGTMLGNHYDGLLQIRQRSNLLTPSFAEVWKGWLQSRGVETLKAAGYLLTDESSTSGPYKGGKSATIAVAGTVTYLTLDTYAPLAGGFARSSMTIRWEMFDVVQQKVVYTVDTNGQGQSLGVSGDAIIVAFDNCLSKLLAEPSFVQKVSKPIDSTPAQTGTWTSELPDPNQIIELPKTTNSLGQNWLSHTSEQSVLVLSGDKGFGTAFVISQSGFILTNYHVVQGQSRLFGKFLNGQTVNVRVIRTSPPDDVALLQIDSVSHDPIPIDLAIAYSPGDDVIAIGNPVDPTLAFSITKGIVSGVRFVGGRTLIQTDVAVNPGSSGGPLIEVKSGRAIGVVSSKLVGVQVEGIAFAIDIRDAFRVLGVSVK